jgi:acetyltransferase-like isoleucine patch superfamily enzyme
MRIAYYCLTLEECSIESRIQFGSFFVHPKVRVAQGVYIGCYCVLGQTSIGERTQIASGVQILSGGQQHPRDSEGRIMGAEHGIFEMVSIGADCWIGAGSIILAEVGEGTTLGSGSVVVYPVPPRSIAMGNPARVVGTTHARLA